MHIFLRIMAVAVLALLVACSTTSQQIDIPQPKMVNAVKEGRATAGVTHVDITPPPGMPKGGYSILGNNSVGFRTRLKARVFYLNDGQGHSVALVQSDLAGSSLLIHHKVASMVAEQTGLAPKDIVVTGTHSHSSVGSHFHNDFYNKHFSNEPGLEPQFVEFLSKQLADGILAAYNSRRVAKIATGRKDIYGINRNRMIKAYARNKGKENIDLDNPETIFKEVNPSLYMIRVDGLTDDGSYKPMGAFSSFSVHATTLSAPIRVYHADLFGFAQRELEWTIADEYKTPWPVAHGLTTGTQGDMAPALPDHGNNYFTHFDVNFIKSRELGQKLGKAAIDLFKSLDNQLTDIQTIHSAAREINLRKNPKIEDIEICEKPYVGNATAGGAYERRTPWISVIPFLSAGWGSRSWFSTGGCQGNRAILGTTLLQPLFEPTDTFPTDVLFQIIRVNDMVILPLPFEMTSESGRRASKRVRSEFAQADNPVEHVWVASVANGYFGYSTTPEEYTYQTYEGGSTLYGRYSTPYIAAQLGVLAKDMQTQPGLQQLLPEWSYYLVTGQFLALPEEAKGQRKVLTDVEYYEADADNEENYQYFSWLDVGPSKINLHQPLARIDVQTEDGWQPLNIGHHMINDEGFDIEVRLLDTEEQGMGEYQVRWYNPEDAPLKNAKYRFVISARGSQPELLSPEFELQQ